MKYNKQTICTIQLSHIEKYQNPTDFLKIYLKQINLYQNSNSGNPTKLKLPCTKIPKHLPSKHKLYYVSHCTRNTTDPNQTLVNLTRQQKRYERGYDLPMPNNEATK